MTSKFKGVYYKSGPGRQKRWCARIMVNGKYHNIGHYMYEEDAANAYRNFIEENKDTLPKRATNLTKNIEDLPRNSNGLIERVCIDCGKLDYFKKVPPSDKCKSCGIRESFRHRPAVGLKELDLESAYRDYQSGISLEEVGKRYGFSAGGIGDKFNKNGYKTRDFVPINILRGNILKAQQKIKEMCETGEFQKNRSAMLQGVPVEEWEGFITPENKLFYKSPEYKELQRQILMRDNFTCQLCSQRGGKLQLHHIKRKCEFPDLKLEKSNCCTVCFNCHNKTKGHEQEYEQFFLDILKNKCIK